MNLDITFSSAPWEDAFEKLAPGEKLDALRLRALTEEDSLEDAFEAMEEKGIGLDVSGLDKIPVSDETAVRLRREKELLCICAGAFSESNDQYRRVDSASTGRKYGSKGKACSG